MSRKPEAEEIGNNQAATKNPSALSDDYVEGAQAIASFLGAGWNERRVYRARETGALPIRRKSGIGIYAFRSELTAALHDRATLPSLTVGDT